MDVWEAIEKRRTVRAFKAPVPEQLLRKIVLAGSRAPSASNSQPWEFVIVNNPKVIEQIAEQKVLFNKKMGANEAALARQKNAYKNSSIVAVCNKKGGFGNAAGWMAALNMQLAACAEGIYGVMSTFRDEPKEAVEKILGLPADCELTTVMVMGVPADVPKSRTGGTGERPEYSWLHINKFGSKGQASL